jgi:uncharacterized protein YqgQ
LDQIRLIEDEVRQSQEVLLIVEQYLNAKQILQDHSQEIDQQT